MILLFILFFTATAFRFPVPHSSFSSSPLVISEPVGDARNNVTDEQFNLIKKLIKQAEDQYNSTAFSKIAQYIFQGLKVTRDSGLNLRWNTYVHASGVKQVGLSSGFWHKGMYVWLINYGKYNFTYVLFASNSAYCGTSHQFGGGASFAQFGQDVNATDADKIKRIVSDSVLYQGDDIQQAATYLKDKLGANLQQGDDWDVVITDPSVSYGYYICRSYKQYWAALRSYEQFKWNYFLSVHT